MGTKRVKSGALHGAMRGNLRQNRERRYTEAVERQAKYNDKHNGVNLCERGAQPNPRKDTVKVIECGPKKERKRKAPKKIKKVKE